MKHHRHRRAFDTVFDVYFSLFSHGDRRPDGELDTDAQGDDGGCARAARAKPARVARAGVTACRARSSPRCSLNALHEHGPGRAAPARRARGAAVRGHGAGAPGRRHLLPLPHAPAARPRRPRSRGSWGRRRSEARSGRASSPTASPARSTRHGSQELRELVEEEIRRRLVADRGVEAMARTLRKPLPEDIEFMHASREEMLALQQAVYPLTRALAARLAQRRRTTTPRAPRLPQDRARVAVVRRCARGAEVPEPAPVEAGDHGRRRHLGVGRELRPVHADVRLRDGEPVLEGAVVGVHRRDRRGHALLPGVRRRHWTPCTGSTPKPT